MSLGSFDPPQARRFVQRQLQLIESGLSRKEASALVEQEMEEQQ